MHRKGFTLPELMVVVLIMAVLMAVAVPMFLRAKARSEAKACRATLTIIDSAKKEWALDNPDGGTTPTAAQISTYIDGGFDDLPVCSLDPDANPTPTTSYTIGDINTDPSCDVPFGPDGQDDNGEDDDHALP